jgi:GGDEF domain-containing protein
MKTSRSTNTYFAAFGLTVAAIFAAYLSASINSFENGLIHIALLVSLIAVGLATNLWGGVAASAVAAFAIITLNQYLGVYANQYVVMNIASEIAFFSAAGPLAGLLAKSIQDMQSRVNQFSKIIEERATHDDDLGALKPEWAKVRLEEEALRARNFARPLALALLRFEANANASRADRISALRAIIRMASSASQPPVIVSYLGDDQILCILPEHTEERAQKMLADLQSRAQTELYFPEQKSGIGKPIAQGGRILASVTVLDKSIANSAALLEKAKAAPVV